MKIAGIASLGTTPMICSSRWSCSSAPEPAGSMVRPAASFVLSVSDCAAVRTAAKSESPPVGAAFEATLLSSGLASVASSPRSIKTKTAMLGTTIRITTSAITIAPILPTPPRSSVVLICVLLVVPPRRYPGSIATHAIRGPVCLLLRDLSTDWMLLGQIRCPITFLDRPPKPYL